VASAPTPAPVQLNPDGGTSAPVVAPITTEAYAQADQAAVRLERAVTELNRSMSHHQRHMSIGIHEATGRTIVSVYNSETSEVIREFPPERVLDAHASLMELAGLFMDRRG